MHVVRCASADGSSVSLSAELWRSEGLRRAHAAAATPFCAALAAGSLPAAAFAAYVAQDAYFLDAFARAYGATLRLLPPGSAGGADKASSAVLALLDGVSAELRQHRASAARYGIDLADVTPLPATRECDPRAAHGGARGGAAIRRQEI